MHGSNIGIRLTYWLMWLNPAIAINELILGQRQPKQLYICRGCVLPLVERSFVHCPACGIFHSGRVWSYKNALGNWLGLICPACGAPIPCLWSLASLVLLTLTGPIWWLPVKHQRAKWIEQQHRRIAKTQTVSVNQTSISPQPIDYRRMGWIWAIFMDVTFALVAVFTATSIEHIGLAGLFTVFLKALLGGLLVWLPAGWLFGVWTGHYLEKRGDQSLHLAIDSTGTIIPTPITEQTAGEGELPGLPPK